MGLWSTFAVDDLLPREVLVAIQSRYLEAVAQAEAAYSAEHNERFLTSSLGCFLSHPPLLIENFEITTTNFEIPTRRPEPTGLFRLEVLSPAGRVIRQHGLLFHARNQWRGRDALLLEEARKFSTNFRQAIVIDYSPSGYKAASAAHVAAANGDRKRLRQRMRKLSDVLAIDFVHGRMGVSGPVEVEVSYVFSTRIRVS
jgi:hypothetical protein